MARSDRLIVQEPVDVTPLAAGWRVVVDGVDQTAAVVSLSMTMTLNGRTVMDIAFVDYAPPQFAPLVCYGKDGVTAIFGGLLVQRTVSGLEQSQPDLLYRGSCGDYFSFTDWCSTNLTYTAPVSLKQVLTDLVAEVLTQYGITVAASQTDGPMLNPFTWADKRASDAIRELADRTNYVSRMSPLGALEMLVPGTEPAPFTITDALPNIMELTWRDSDEVPANAVVIIAGPTGAYERTQAWTSDGVGPCWTTDVPAVPGLLTAGYVTVGGIFRTVSTEKPEDAGSAAFTFNSYTSQLCPDLDPVPPAGTLIELRYTAQYPIRRTAWNNETPKVEQQVRYEDVVDPAIAQSLADSTLARLQVAARPIDIETDLDGLMPGQALTIDLPFRGLVTTALITSVSLQIELDTDPSMGARTVLWRYHAQAVEHDFYQSSHLDQWRQLLSTGGGSGSVSVAPTPPPDGGGGGGGTEEVFVGPGDPGAPMELWYDTDEPAPTPGIPDHSISLVKLQEIATQTVLGRAAAGTGTVEVLTTLPTSIQSAITRLGIITSGVWTGTPITLPYLGSVGAAGSFVQSNGANWVASTVLLPTSVTVNGVLYATAPNTIGTSPNLTFTGSALALVGDQTLTGFLGSATYASQTTGWRIDSTGGADFRYAFIDEMHAKSFITDLEMALAGGQIISKSVAMVAAPFTVPAAGGTALLQVRDLPSMADVAAFQSGDTVMLRRFSRTNGALNIAECIGTVSGYVDQPDGTQTWTFTRGSGANGGNMSGGVVAVDSLALDFGVSGNGYYEVNAIDGAYGANSPYAQIVTWSVAPTGSNKVIRTRFGKLTGITGQANEYGMLAGSYAASNGSYFRASNTTFELHNITAQWWAGFTPVVIVSPGGGNPYISLGNPAYAAPGQGPGIVLSYSQSAGKAQFWCYAPGGTNYLVFDGTVLYWKAVNTTLDTAGNLTATSATLSGAITATSGLVSGDFVIGTGGQMRSGAQSYGAGIGWWLDYNAGVPRFRIGNPNADRLSWDGTTLTVRSGKLLIDGSASGHIGMGAAPYSIATLNIAADTDDATSYGLLVTNHSGTVPTLLTYGDGRLFLGGQLYILPGAWDITGQGQNPPSIWNGPFGYEELSGWMRVYIYTGAGGGIPPTGPYERGWIPVWLG